MNLKQILSRTMPVAFLCLAGLVAPLLADEPAGHTFAIGTNDFLLAGRRFQIRCGEIHAARVPREYWRHRLQMARAMGLNTVCAYLFWNQIEPRPGEFNWSGCRLGIDGVRQERFRGEMDELFIADRALEPLEIVQLMKDNQLPQSELAAVKK
jgi:hypothetical protein